MYISQCYKTKNKSWSALVKNTEFKGNWYTSHNHGFFKAFILSHIMAYIYNLKDENIREKIEMDKIKNQGHIITYFDKF